MCNENEINLVGWNHMRFLSFSLHDLADELLQEEGAREEGRQVDLQSSHSTVHLAVQRQLVGAVIGK
jgi:hypothetical protein